MLKRKLTKQYIENKYWVEFLTWIRTALPEEKMLYQLVSTHDGENVNVSISRNMHNFWYWYETHKGIHKSL